MLFSLFTSNKVRNILGIIVYVNLHDKGDIEYLEIIANTMFRCGDIAMTYSGKYARYTPCVYNDL